MALIFRKDQNGFIVPVLSPVVAQAPITLGTSSADSAVLQNNVIRLISTVDCFYEVGAAPTATTSSHFLLAKTPCDIYVEVGHKVAAVVSADSGTLYVSELG